jgi:nucleoside-diphosphate-sugar epimerase
VPDFLILGCGFTGRRVAQRLLARGCTVLCTTRDSLNLETPGALSTLSSMVTSGVRVLHSVPTLAGELDRVAVDALHGAARVVYLSTTAVYGGAECVDETTPVAPQSDRARARVRTERAVLDGPWLPLVLRPAAIYGPGRGVQVSMRHGSGCVSRIHVDDLAAHVEAALFSEVAGAWPVADDHPCPSSEIANFILLHPEWGRPVACGGLGQGRSRAGLLIHGQGRHLSFARGQGRLSHASRRVDGSAIRRILGIALRYPSYRTGIPAALAEQRHACHDIGFQ